MPNNKTESKSDSDSKALDFEMTCPRLSAWQWLLLLVVCVVLSQTATGWWNQFELFKPTASYRIPYELSTNYGLYRRFTESTADGNHILMLGDSVVWGEYTSPDDALPACLNRACNTAKIANINFESGDSEYGVFANGGLNGMHPIAMAGLVKHYSDAITNQKVIVHCNLLWMSSPERDLSSQDKQSFNHEKLVPQFASKWPYYKSSVPSYQQNVSERLKYVVQREFEFRDTVHHVRNVYYDGRDLHSWTIDHPYDNPIAPITLKLPVPKTELRHPEKSWLEKGVRPTRFDWVSLNESRQWQGFVRVLSLLEQRNNDVLVMVGPFNTHLLKVENRQRFQDLRDEVIRRLQQRQISYFSPRVLPQSMYADASHPLAIGYRELADQFVADPSSKKWLEK